MGKGFVITFNYAENMWHGLMSSARAQIKFLREGSSSVGRETIKVRGFLLWELIATITQIILYEIVVLDLCTRLHTVRISPCAQNRSIGIT